MVPFGDVTCSLLSLILLLFAPYSLLHQVGFLPKSGKYGHMQLQLVSFQHCNRKKTKPSFQFQQKVAKEDSDWPGLGHVPILDPLWPRGWSLPIVGAQVRCSHLRVCTEGDGCVEGRFVIESPKKGNMKGKLELPQSTINKSFIIL